MGRKGRANPVLWFAGGVVAGTAIGWLTAPRRGDWLRNQARQKLLHWRRVTARRFGRREREIENRVRGTVAEVRNAFAGREHYVDANTLVDQVHSQLGREFAPALEHVNLNGKGHTIYLHGYVSEGSERERLVEAIGGIEGVEKVDASELRVGRARRPRVVRGARSEARS